MYILIKKPAVIADLPVHLISYVYENTYKGSELRRWISHAMAYAALYLDYFHLLVDTQESPVEFRQDVAAASEAIKDCGCCGDGLISVFHKYDYHVRNQSGYCLHSPGIDGEWHRLAAFGRLSMTQDDDGCVWMPNFWGNCPDE